MRTLNTAQTVENLTHFIKNTVASAQFSSVVVAVSGGVDSATSVALATRALGPQNVHALLLPYKDWHTEAVEHAQLTLNSLKIPATSVHAIDIALMVDAFKDKLALADSEYEKLRLGNIMARVRMIALFDFAKANNCLVVGTENKSEHYLGYYTRFGDEASDIEPLRNLYKTEVFQLAKYLNVPKEILEKAPTAGLWAGQTDEGQFGFSYKEADEIMYQFFDLKKSETELVGQGIAKETIEKVKTWVKSVSFKHNLPYLPAEPIFE